LLLDEDGGLACEVQPMPPPFGPEAAWTFALSDKRIDRASSFTYHKTTRRGFLDRERARLAKKCGCDEVLFLNSTGELSEGSISTIFILRGGRLLTPPLASGLLAGTLRAEMLASGQAREAVLTPDDLERAEAVFLGNSVRGLVRAHCAGEVPA
jgi:para-aminobenzoate synthetase/4-amino-4-deoxychorismate lyase